MVGLTADLARARAASRGPVETAILALAAAGRDDEAEKQASEALARWPESEAARRVLRAAAERRRRAEAARFMAEAEAAAATGDTEGALAALARAAGVALAPDREAIERRVREVEAAARSRREAARVEEVRRLLHAADPREGLLAYLELPEPLRASVRAGDAGEPVRWLELTARGAARGRVEAVLALARARELVGADAARALAVLAPHAGTLDRVPEARRVTQAAEARLEARRLVRAMEIIAAAQAAFAAGRAEEAGRRLDDPALRDLPEAERCLVESLRESIARIVARERRETEVSRLRQGGHLLDARDLAAELAASAEGEEQARWEGERRALQQAIQEAFRVEVHEPAEPLDGGFAPFPRFAFWDTVSWLTADGRSLVLAEGIGLRVVINVVERAGLVVRTAVLVRTPEPVDKPWVEVIGRTLWLVSRSGAVLALSLDGWEVLVFRAAPERSAQDLAPVPALPSGRAGPRFVWMKTGHPDGPGEPMGVFALQDHRPPRLLPGVTHAVALRGMPEARVASLVGDAIVLYEDRGVPLPGGRGEALGGKALGVALRPDGEGLVALVEIARGEQRDLAWVDVPFHGAPRAPQIIEDAVPAGTGRIHSGRDPGVVVITLWNRQGRQSSPSPRCRRRTPRRRGSPRSGASPTRPRGW